jgi:CRISPR-associated protein Csd2
MTEMGRKHIVPYGLYRAEGYISAKLANDPTKGTGFSEEDLNLFWDALVNMFEHDHSAARGKMAARRLIVFKHESDLGNAPSHKLFELVKVARKDGVVVPRQFDDYSVKVDGIAPKGVELIEKL